MDICKAPSIHRMQPWPQRALIRDYTLGCMVKDLDLWEALTSEASALAQQGYTRESLAHATAVLCHGPNLNLRSELQ